MVLEWAAPPEHRKPILAAFDNIERYRSALPPEAYLNVVRSIADWYGAIVAATLAEKWSAEPNCLLD
jgi:hypothetical protein